MPPPELSEAKRKLLARMLSGAAPTPRGLDAPIAARAAGTVAPISADQQKVWLHATTAGDVPLYNEPVTIHRDGPFDLDAFARTLGEVMRRHEIWRTSLEVRDGGPVQVVHDPAPPAIAFDDLSALPEAERDAAAVRLAAADVARPLDLATAPLLRVRVVRLAPARHRLYFTLHHLIFDGVSVHRVLPGEIAAIYAAFAAGREPALPPPPLQYGDYALWREQARGTPARGRQLDYWRAELAGDPDPLRLPSDRARPAVPGFAGGVQRFSLPPGLVERVRALARGQGATLYMVMLAAYEAMLFRYAGQADMLVGGIVDLRRRPELRDLLGYFLNAVAIRTAPRPELPFAGLLAQVKAKLLGAIEHADVPFDEVVRAVSPRREAGSAPIFQVLFSMQPPPEAPPPGWDLTQMDVPTGVAKFDLYLELEERADGLLGRFIYRSDLFDAATVERMIGHYLALLGSACAEPARPLARLAMLTDAERRDLLHTWNESAAPIPAQTLPELIAAQAARVPDAVAISGGDRSLTYAELDGRVLRLGAMLRRAGAGPGALVAVCASRSPDLVVALLAVLRAGAAYLPLDPALPRERFAALLADARPAIVLTEVDLLGVLPRTETPLVLLEDIDLSADATGPVAPPAPDDLAYVLYTSGSTGAPKGVEITHRSLVNLLAGMGRALGITERDVVLAITTVSFDIAAVELFLPLTLGGRIVMASRDEVVDPRRLIELIAASACTVLQATPAGWRGLVAAGWAGKPDLLVLSGGEALPRSLARDLMQRSRAVWNGYGPTETTIYSAAHRVRDEAGAVPIGRPTANTQLHVLDAHGELVPVGVPGELHIAGDGLARGYRGRADLTAGRFATRPGVPGARLYATGDLVRQRAGGEIVWLGRIDNQVKVRGYRVELGEVTETLARHPGVAAAAVIDYRDAAGETGLLACTVARDEAAPPTTAELRRFLRQSLPEYVVPARYLAVSSLPLTPNGKVDRFALLALADAAPASASPPAALSPAARALAPIWQEVLGVRSADAADNFFEVGGHSLLAARLLMAVEARLGQRLSMTAIFRAQTLGAIAALLEGGAAAAPPSPSEGAATRALLSGFESLGEDCEFGLLQRRFGAEPLGLFRFADVPLPVLVAALERDLVGIDDPGLLELGFDEMQRTSMVRHRALGFGYILFDRVDPDPAAQAALRLREARRLGFLRRKFLEDVARAGKVWVLKGGQVRDAAQVARLLRWLRARGPAVLLCVDLADAAHEPGTVAAGAEPGLLRAWIDRYAPPEAMQDSSPLWLDLCQQARAMADAVPP